MPQTVNNENEYRITRSKAAPTVSTVHLSLDDSQQPVSVDTRQYLGDISNQMGVVSTSTTTRPANLRRRPLGGDIAPLQQQTRTNTNVNSNITTASNLAFKNQSQRIHDPLASTAGNDDNVSDIENRPSDYVGVAESSDKTAVPARLPQKRQATESLTNLVEKLRGSNLSNNSTTNNTGSYKKSKLIDYEWQDLDEEDLDDPLMASEYVNDIMHYFYELERRMLPDPQYLFRQRHLKPKMRSILVDWLVEMHLKFRLLPESLFLAINLMDRFMSLEVVQIDKLQLLATGSLFIAAKYEEVFSPSVKNYAYFTDGSYSEDEILQAEKYILTVLNFDLNYPNPMNFLRRISKADDYDVQSRTLGKYLLEITAIDYKFIGYKPSLCCASAMYLARLILGKSPVWNGNLIHYSGGYRVNNMKVCVEMIFQYLISPVEHDEFFKKYATRKFMKASMLCRSWAKKFHAEGKDLFDEKLSTHRLTIEN